MNFNFSALILIPSLIIAGSLSPMIAPPLLAQAKSEQAQGRPWLGIAIEKGSKGVLIKGVIPETPAEQAGLKIGDEVLSIDKKPVNEPSALISLIQNSGIGQTVTVEIQRGQETISKSLKLVMRPDELKIIRDKLVGKPAPAFNLKSIHGKESGSSDKLKGRVTIIEFWATWCPACRASHPRLSEFAQKHPDIAVIAISDEDKATLRTYAKQTNPKFTILQDPSHKVPETWMASAIPMLVVLDKKGIVTFVTVGAGEDLEEALTKATN